MHVLYSLRRAFLLFTEIFMTFHYMLSLLWSWVVFVNAAVVECIISMILICDWSMVQTAETVQVTPLRRTLASFPNPNALVAFSALTLLVGRQEGIRPVKNGDGGGGHWLVRMEWRPAGWSVCLPLLIFPCTIKSEVLFWHWLTRVVPKKGPWNGCDVVWWLFVIDLEAHLHFCPGVNNEPLYTVDCWDPEEKAD